MSAKISVCLLTCNSMRTLASCLSAALQVADELIIVDSGSSDGTLELLGKHRLTYIHRPYSTHAQQMNFAISQASNDWVLCLDSDETMDSKCIQAVNALKSLLHDPTIGYRLQRYWRVLGRDVHALYPVSSPDRPIRLFNRQHVRFNDEPVDDKATGWDRKEIIDGTVLHDTFFSVDELLTKLHGYTTRLARHKKISPSLIRAFLSPPFAFIKWYLRKGAYRDGSVGIVTATYAALYSFLKYFRAWCQARKLP